MLPNLVRGALGAAAFAYLTVPTPAHVAFEVGQAPGNATYRATLRVPHGWGGQATRTLRIQVPEGVLDVKPMPKPGWTLTTTRGPYGKAYNLSGKPVGEGVREIVWSGGELPDKHYDEFVFQARLTSDLAGRIVPFPVMQECATAVERWVEVAPDGQDAHALKFPAPAIRVGASSAAGAAASTAAPVVYRIGSITIAQPWSRATPGAARVAGGYMRLTNTGTEPDRLVGGTFAASGRFELHEMSVGTDHVMRMRPLDAGLEIKPGESVDLKPGSYHAMFLDLRRPLKEGETIGGTLRFEKAGTVEVTYAVQAIGAQGAASADEHKHH